MAKLKLTAGNVNKLPFSGDGQVLYRDTELLGFGLRVGASVKTYFVEKRVDGRTVRHSLGIHGQITADKARLDAVVALGKMTAGSDLNQAKKARAIARKLEQTSAAAPERTLKALCEWYVKHQKAKGKESAKDAENIFKNHVYASEFASDPAKDITAKQATVLLRRLVEAEKVRTAAKLRAYLRAAYALALGAETNAEAPSELVLFNIETNPIASTGALSAGNKAREVTLSEAELGETLRLLEAHRLNAYDDALAAVELSIYLGGQRLAQVLRAEHDDVDVDAQSITLWDSKGRRKTARKHILPMTLEAAKIVEAILKVRRAKWLFGDKTAQTVPDTVARKGGALLRQAQDNLKIKNGRDIQVRDLRRTAETMMAAMGISKDLRAQIQSHGLGGVQDRHYDRHDYMQEKRRALEAWGARLNELMSAKPAASNVRRLAR